MADTNSTESPVPTKTSFTRMALKAQCSLLKRGWAGPMGDFVMVLTHRGRKTGRAYETPVAYLRRDGELLGVSGRERISNWYRNVMAAGEAELNILGKSFRARVEPIDDPEEIANVFECFRADYQGFERAFGCDPQAPEPELLRARDAKRYLRWTPL